MKERILVRITRPDFTTIHNTFINATIQKDETGISIYLNESRMLAAFYPLRWAVVVVEVELID